eukprot:57981_1
MAYSYYDYLANEYESYYIEYYKNYYEYTYGNGSNTTYNGTYPPSPYQYTAPYKMEYIIPSLSILLILCLLLSVYITALICYKLRIQYTKRHGVSKAIMYLTLFSVLMHLCHNIMDAAAFYVRYINYSPMWFFITEVSWEVLWLLSKVSLYILFIYRYYLVFNATPGTTNAQKYTIFGSFTVAMVVQCVLMSAYVVLYHIQDSSKQRVWLAYCWCFLAIDAILISILTYLLSHSVLRLVLRIQKSQEESIEFARVSSLTPATQSGTAPEFVSQTSRPHSVVDQQSKRLAQWKNTATKVAVTMIVSMASSFVYQLVFIVGHEIDSKDLLFMEKTWCVDSVINMLCIYLSMAFAHHHYKRLCIDCCKLHKCMLGCIKRLCKIT